MKIKVPTNSFQDTVWVEVTARKISIERFGEFYVHRRIENNKISRSLFVVSEESTLCAIPCKPGMTRDEAVFNAKEFLERRGVKEFHEAIKLAKYRFSKARTVKA